MTFSFCLSHIAILVDAGFRRQDAGFRMRDAGFRMRDEEF